MTAGFLEMSRFTRWVTEELSDEEYVELQKLLAERPYAGALIPGCGGVRKLRFAVGGQNKGKRGGARIIYYYVEEPSLFLMIAGYNKNVTADLSPEAKRLAVQLTREFKAEYARRRESSQ